MDFYADVLDHTGRTPREFGAIHLHVEPVLRGPLGDAVATLWLQGAFEPLGSGHAVQILGHQKNGPARRMLGRFPLPSLEGGTVVRWRLPFSLPAEIDELHFRVESTLHPKAERVRPAWKLFDTLEIAKESDMKSTSLEPSIGVDIGESLLSSVLSGGLSVSIKVGMATRDGSSLSKAVHSKLHAATQLPEVIVIPVVDGNSEPLPEPHIEVVWKPGMSLPEASVTPTWAAASPAVANPPQKAMRTCYACGFEGPQAEYARATLCPQCDATWM
ncbi:hypothetical protein [Archangium lansingense]|uniref:Arrestin-like N-terminal domain-containing protein n=1 Tax=Archangium lansingense TaxID=2995310 RepID=A0ABT4A7R3_9BACT|nr:hypothetical protein [Archangium lansinium]MCY1077636.1 hypothetical protein [Archangium lansinium]